MDLRDNGSLASLESLIEEFFNPITDNNRKQEIESQLNYFKTLPCLSNYCIYFIMNTTSQYVKMFALCTLETVITQQWSNIEWSSKEEVKNTIQNCFVEQGLVSPHYLRNKYSKLLVEIARHDWPGFYPNFFNNILELIQTEGNQLIGLVLLRMTSEEFMGIQAMFKNTDRKQEIVRLLHQHIPEVLEVLKNILENLGSKPRHTSTATPPPSPAHPSSSSPPVLQPSAQIGGASFRIDNKALAREALQTVQSLFTWVPFQIIPKQMIKAVFGFTIVSSYSQDDDDMCVLAMSTLNELLYRKCIPPESHEFFVQLYHEIMSWLREVTSSSNRIDTMDPAFMEKLSELLILMIEHHMWRLESNPEFTMVEFLSPLFQLTMQFSVVQSYLSCLSVWAAFMKQVKLQNVKKYSEVFVELITALLKKLQFTYNSSQLNLLDDKLMDEDNQTDWQIFFKSTVEVIAMVAEFSPHDTFSLVITPWKICYDIFRNMEHAVDYQSHALKFQMSETEKLCYVLKDFSSLTQTLTRLASVCINSDSGNQGQLSMSIMNSLFEKILESATIMNKVRFYNLNIDDLRITECFIEIHGQLLAALKTLLVWTTQKNSIIDNDNVKALLELTLPLLRCSASAPPKVAHSAAHLVLSLTNVVFAPSVVVIPTVGQFISEAPTLKFCDIDTAHVVNKAVSNLLLKSWGNLSQEDSDQRTTMVNTFFDRLTNDFRLLTPDTPEDSVRTVVENVLPSLSIVTENCQNLPMASKKLMAAAIRPTVQHALYLFPTFVRYKEISNHILIFFLNVMGVLQQQLGVEDTKNAVQVFLQVTMNEHQDGTMNCLDKLVQILQLVVEAPGNAWKTFLPGILQLCMESVYPLVVSQAGHCPDVFAALLALLYRILLHRWQYFYVSQVRLGYSPGCSDSDLGPDHPQKPEQLLAILQVFGQALLQQDMNIFRLSLVALEDLNGKWKLYHKAIFRNNLLSEFLTVLINCLLDKSQSSLSEDIQVVIYNMAAVNFDEFFSAFLVRFVQNMEGVSPQQCEILLRNFVRNHDKDLPTFVHNLQGFVKDAQHFRMCNTSSSISNC